MTRPFAAPQEELPVRGHPAALRDLRVRVRVGEAGGRVRRVRRQVIEPGDGAGPQEAPPHRRRGAPLRTGRWRRFDGLF